MARNITAKTDNKEKTKKKDRFKVLRIIKNIVLGVTIAFLTLVLIVSMMSRLMGKAPSLFGYSLYRVSSGSMKPELQVGDIIIVQECDGDTVQKEDIVSFIATSGEMSGKLVTHRVVKAPYKEGSLTYVVTKGDANQSSDDPIPTKQIQGKMLTKIGFLKYLFDFYATPWGLITLIVLILLAFSNEIIILIKSLFGIGLEPEPQESVQDIIERIQKENREKELSNASDGEKKKAHKKAEKDSASEE